LGAGWVTVVLLRRRALERRFGERQLRGVGSNGRISYERYLLREHRVSRRASLLPPGPTAVSIELGAAGKATAHAPEGAYLLEGANPQPSPARECPLEHEATFVIVRDLYSRRYVFLDRDPTADELLKRHVPDAPSYTGESRDSDVIVLLDEQQNLVPPSDLGSALAPTSSSDPGRSSDDVVVATSSEERVIVDSDAVLDAGSSDDTTSSSEEG
jgi:hypothetical protein